MKFGSGASDWDAGWELKPPRSAAGVMLVTDPGVAALEHPERIQGLIEAEGIEVVLYARARVEPTIESLQDAVDFALEHEVDGFRCRSAGQFPGACWTRRRPPNSSTPTRRR